MNREHTQFVAMTFDSPAVSADCEMRVTYNYEPGSGPLYRRGEPLPISPAEPPEVEVTQVEVRRERTVRRRDIRGNVTREETVYGDWVDVTRTLEALLTGDDWNEIAEHIASGHEQEMREAAE